PTRRARGIRPVGPRGRGFDQRFDAGDRKSTRLNSSHPSISYAVFCLEKDRAGNPKPLSLENQRKARESVEQSGANSKQLFFFKVPGDVTFLHPSPTYLFSA